MSKKDDFKKKLKEIKSNIDDGSLTSEKEIENMVNDLFEMMNTRSLKDKIFQVLFSFLNFFVILFLGFCISYSFFVDSFNLDNRWFILVIFLILTTLVFIEKIVSNLLQLKPHIYVFFILGLFNITLFTVLNFFLNFSLNTMLFNVLYCLGLGINFLANFILMRRKFRKVLE